jgi:lipooligosaccharide transport system permease protein
MTLMTRVVELRALQYRRTFRASIFTSFLNPALFLAAMGVGLGMYVDQSSTATAALDGLTYLQFLAPGLLAATAMQSAAFEATFPIMSGLNWQRTFHAMYATPISPRDIVLGNMTWVAIRLTSIAEGSSPR